MPCLYDSKQIPFIPLPYSLPIPLSLCEFSLHFPSVFQWIELQVVSELSGDVFLLAALHKWFKAERIGGGRYRLGSI